MDQIILSKAETYIFHALFGTKTGDAYVAILQGAPGVSGVTAAALSKAEVWLLTHIFGTARGEAMIASLTAAGVVSAG